jgi:hypothetical protein
MPAAAGSAEAQRSWDVAGTVGLFSSHIDARVDEGYVEDWGTAAQAGVVAGRYLSRHLKIELEGSTTTRVRTYGAVPTTVPGVPDPRLLFAEVRTSVRSAGGAVTWQFRDNEWVHPFVQAGVSVDWDDSIVHVPQQFYFGDPRGPAFPLSEGYTERRTTTHVRGVFGGGAKLYFTERAFVRTDARLSWGSERQNLALRAGVGIDF